MTNPAQRISAIGWSPEAGDRILLAGDAASLPDMREILDSLGARAVGQVFVEVDSADAVQQLAAPPRFAVSWLDRSRGQSLGRSVDAWLSEMLPISDVETPRVYAWIAAEGSARAVYSD